ncbi:hypothetical protein N6N95_24655, partial [Escherichia coli]|nr:hypothetical protein [Escherichia coli]MDC7061936.1 hypothetical protein [Escherichia coli]MDC7083194.1 hypothetical protein [Escherichia coli]
RNRSHWSTSKTPSYTKSVSWQHHPFRGVFLIFLGFKFLSMNKKSIKPLLNMILMVKKSKQPVN